MASELFPTNLRHAKLVYQIMFNNSSLRPMSDLTEFGFTPKVDDPPVRIFRDFITKLCLAEGIKESAVASANRLLTTLGCIARIKHGSPGTPSIYTLHFAPTDEMYENMRERAGLLNKKILPSRADLLKKDIEDLRDVVSSLRGKITELEERLRLLEYR